MKPQERATPFVRSLCPNDFGAGRCDYPECRDSMCGWWLKGDAFAQALDVFRDANIRDGHAAGRAEALEMAVQIALAYRDEADGGKHPDARDPDHSLGQGFAANIIAKRIRSLATAPTGEKDG